MTIAFKLMTFALDTITIEVANFIVFINNTNFHSR